MGQLPQFDARMLYWRGQSGVTGLQMKVSSFETWLTLSTLIFNVCSNMEKIVKILLHNLC